ncbi:aminotransferase class III-fold pyridoxal phosphate-dependent enzyme, partial [bacterium]|nr:aminotransferase class III-fold pyridoxal phosphate-dependent enzyme [bacterium]
MFDYLFNSQLSSADEQRILKETFSYYDENLNPGFLKYKRSVKHDAQGVEWRGEGAYMYDIHGHRFLDCLCGYGVFTLGHRHPHVMTRVK